MAWTEQELPKKALPRIDATEKALLESMEDLETAKPHAKLCVYGDQGSGKTVAAMEFAQAFTPADKGIVYVDSKENWSTLLNHPELKRRVKRIKYINYEQVMALAKAIERKQPPFDQIGAVVVDEFNSIIAMDLTWIVKARAKQAELDNSGFKDPFQPTQPDYLASQVRSNDLTDTFMKGEINLFYTSHEKLDEKDMTIRPDMKPGAANDMQRSLHGVFRSTIDEVPVERDGKKIKVLQRRLQLQPVKRVSCKNRIGGLGVFATTQQVIDAYEKWGMDDLKATEEIAKKETEELTSEKQVQNIADLLD